jgi:hypothetical protein
VREEAAVLCSIAACWPTSVSVSRVSDRLYGEPYCDVAWLAVRAWDAAHTAFVRAGREATDSNAIRDDYAEAEALLRTGW